MARGVKNSSNDKQEEPLSNTSQEEQGPSDPMPEPTIIEEEPLDVAEKDIPIGQNNAIVRVVEKVRTKRGTVTIKEEVYRNPRSKNIIQTRFSE